MKDTVIITKDEFKDIEKFSWAKVITHEEARDILVNDTKLVWNKTEFANDYITQQEVKDERAKKEHELLELYQLRDNYQSHTIEYHKIQKGIKTLEKELEELK